MKTGDIVLVHPMNEPTRGVHGVCQLISANGLSAMILFPDLPWFMKVGTTAEGMFVSGDGAHLLATRAVLGDAWQNIVAPFGPPLIIEKAPDDALITDPPTTPPPGCRFYGHVRFGGELFPNPGSNQCALIITAHSPCQMEIAGQTPDEGSCPLIAEVIARRITEGGPTT